jgi:hypothetical protein
MDVDLARPANDQSLQVPLVAFDPANVADGHGPQLLLLLLLLLLSSSSSSGKGSVRAQVAYP